MCVIETIMELHQVQYFLQLCNDQNFTKAAKKCAIAQPSLTRAIKLLEKEFGGELFLRGNGAVQLTELGRIVLPYLQDVWESAAAVKKLASEIAAREPIPLRVGVMCTIAPKLFIDTVANFRLNHPQERLEVIDGTAMHLERKLMESDIDVAIFARPKKDPNPRLHYMTLFREQMMIVIPKSHKFASFSSVRVQDLAGEAYVMRALCEFSERSGKEFEAEKSTWKMVYKSDRDDWVFAMISSGFGFGFVPKHSVVGSDLIARPLIEPEFWRDVNLATVLNQPQSQAVGAFVHEAMKSDWPK